MSQNSNARKQELLSQLADSRLTLLESAENVASRVESACNWADNVKEKIVANPAVWAGSALVGGLVVSRLVSSFFSKEKESAQPVLVQPEQPHSMMRSLSGAVLRGAGSIFMSAVMPIMKSKAIDLMQGPVSSILNRWGR
jgi:hypothetical protein